jgi:YbbR domain-containing protein
MISWRFITNNLAMKVLSLTVATILWFLVTAEKQTEQELAVPLLFKNMPPGFHIANHFPEKVDVRVAGPGILMTKLQWQKMALTLDLRNLKEGPAAFTDLSQYLKIPNGLHLTRIYPSVIELKLVQNERKIGRMP